MNQNTRTGLTGINTASKKVVSRNLLMLIALAFIALANSASAQLTYVQYPQRYGPNSNCRQPQPQRHPGYQGGQAGCRDGRSSNKFGLELTFEVGARLLGGGKGRPSCSKEHRICQSSRPCNLHTAQRRAVTTTKCVTTSVHVDYTPLSKEETNAGLNRARSLKVPPQELQAWLQRNVDPRIRISLNKRAGGSETVRRESGAMPQSSEPAPVIKKSGWVGDTFYRGSSTTAPTPANIPTTNAPIWTNSPEYREAPGVGRSQHRVVKTSTDNYVVTSVDPREYFAKFPGPLYNTDIGTAERAEHERLHPGENPYRNSKRW